MKTTIEAESSSPRNTGSDVEPARTAKPRKKLNRQPASCSGCRQRRTRCDRGRPCLECHKRKTTCDYTGASAPPSIPPVSIFDQVEREEYIKRLEARLEALEKSTPPTKPSSASSTPPAHDFSLDDLAAQLSIITIGKRVRAPISDSEPHTLRTQLESIMASQSNLPPITFIQPEQQFSLDLVAKYLVPSLEELCSEHLPSRPQIDILAQCFLNTVNLWSPVINPFDWNIQLDAFWNSTDRLNFRPTPTPSNPPHLTRHYLTQFIAILYAVMGHGLSTLADIHHLESTPENQSSVGSPTSSPPRDDHLWTLSQAEKISLANRWFRFSLGLLMSPEGNIYVKPTIFGIRAMSILSNVEHAPENLDHGIFFWSLTSNLAISVGLFREPPIADDEDIETLDETEIESRRELAWSILALDWAGYVVANGKRPLNDADQISVKFPGTVISRATKIDPADGWPENPLVCIRRLAAQMDHLMRQVDVKVLSGHPVTYEDLAETVKRLDQLESSVPPRLQMRLSADGKSLETVVKSITAQNVPVAFLHARFCVPRMRLHRLFIFPKPVVPPEERLKQLKMLLTISKQHFLAVQHYPHHLSMHPLIIYSLINTAVPCALVLLINQQTHELEIEEDFFLAQLHKTTALFDLGKRTMAATMARKAITLLKTIIQQIELRSRSAGSKNWDRRKKGPAVALEINQTTVSTDGRDEVIKRKQPKVHTKSHEPANFQFQQYEFGMPSAESPQAMQHNRQRSGQPAMHSISSSDSIIPTSQVMIPTHASSSITSHHLGSSTAEAFSVQPTPPSVPSQPSQRPGFSTHSSSSQFSLTLDNTCLDRLNSGPSIRPIVNLPRSYYLNSTVEFGKFNTQLDNHQFEFRALQSFPQVYVESGGHAHAGAEEVGAYNTNGQTNRLDNPEFLLPQLSCSQMESASSQSAGSLAPFEPTFNLDFGLTDAVVSTASLADLAHPPGFLGFAPDPQTRSAIDELGPHEINNPSRGCFRRRGSHQPPQQTANIVTTTTATTDHYVDSHAHYHHPYFGLRYRPSQNPHG